ncbi:hypothetical protein MKW92_022353 [Papaver armeniacum]|nr:hypothetical protein MKW92_022353 [Papaver armeniacum]
MASSSSVKEREGGDKTTSGMRSSKKLSASSSSLKERKGKTMADRRSSKGLRTSSSSISEKSRMDKPNELRQYSLKECQDFVRPYATEAISFYNDRNAGAKYELVEPGNHTPVLLATCFVHHVDFTAKKTDVPDAPEEMFFAELTTTDDVRHVTFCKCMGPKNLITGDKNNGCCFCKSYNVQHPTGGGFKAGRHGLFPDEENYRLMDLVY